MKRREMSPAARVQYDIARYLERRAWLTRMRANELMAEAEAFEREQTKYRSTMETDQHVRDDARRYILDR